MKNFVALIVLSFFITSNLTAQCWNEWEKTNEGNKLSSLTTNGVGDIWGLSASGSIWHWENNKWVNRNPGNKLASLTSIRVGSGHQGKGELWGLASGGGVWRWENGNGHSRR